ncbi:hypothetical protein M1555_00235 [Patescibacteria group bacterium]|nr:hypothetical protein [Patescibacteria group bacterium]
MSTRRQESGQILLITLLILSVVSTIVLSLVGRSTTDVAITNQITESARAFSAAEAGVELSLQSGAGSGGVQVLSPGVTYNVTRADIGGAPGVYQFPKKTTKGTSEILWLVNHNSDGSLSEVPTYTASSIDVCWSSETTMPALIVSVYYKAAGSGNYLVARGAYDPDANTGGARSAANHFSAVTATTGGCGAGTGTAYKETITFSSFSPAVNPTSDTLLFMKLQPVYSDTSLAINAGSALPLQGNRIESSGSSSTGITRKIIVYQLYRSPPSLLDNVISSEGSFGH